MGLQGGDWLKKEASFWLARDAKAAMKDGIQLSHVPCCTECLNHCSIVEARLAKPLTGVRYQKDHNLLSFSEGRFFRRRSYGMPQMSWHAETRVAFRFLF